MFWTGRKTSEKSNEITAIPEPLELLDLKDGIGMVRSRRHNKKTKEDSYNWQQTKFMYQTPELPWKSLQLFISGSPVKSYQIKCFSWQNYDYYLVYIGGGGVRVLIFGELD